MATNVNPEELNYDHYETEKYDDDIVRSIPGHEELHRHIDQLVESLPEQLGILELGVGTGLTAERILKRRPHAEYTAVDFSEQMLAGARRRLAQYNVTFVNGDYSLVKLSEDNDLVVSVVGIHHQETDEDKKRLFQRIYESSDEGGAFIFGDLVTYRNPIKAWWNQFRHFRYLKRNARDEESYREWKDHHKRLNRLAPLKSQVKWLEGVGFSQVDVVYRKFNTALVYAKK